MSFDRDYPTPRAQEGGSPRFIISIDYGTTYTGVAWTLTTGADPMLEKIEVVDSWEGAVQAKVPSKFTYTECPGRKWGYGISPEAFVIQLTKLELEPPNLLDALRVLRDTLDNASNSNSLQINSRKNVVDSEVPQNLTNSPEQIMTDYLKEVAKYVRSDIEAKRIADNLAEWPIDLVITHPAIWHSRAKNITFRAVNNAFRYEFHEMATNHGCVRLATEPEACAQYTMHNVRKQGLSSLRKGDCFVVVDAGGGTVDLVSYKVEELLPSFRVSKITMASGAKCGATLIDDYFIEKFLRRRLGEVNWTIIKGDSFNQGRSRAWRGAQRELLESFDGPIKQTFAGFPDDDSEPPVQFLFLPEQLAELHDPHNGIEHGRLSITCDDLEEMFHEPVEGTLELIRHQLAQISAQNYTARAIFLSGGFSESEYLRKRVKAFADKRGCQFHCDGDRWTAVAQGAVLMGLGARCDLPPAQLQCPVNIGVFGSTRFSEVEHDTTQRYRDTLDGIQRGRKIDWVVHKGDLVDSKSGIRETVHVHRKFIRDGDGTGRVTVVISSDDIRPNEQHIFGSERLSTGSNPGRLDEINLDYDLANMLDQDGITRRPGQKIQRRGVIPSSQQVSYREVEMRVVIRVTQQGGRAELFLGDSNEAQLVGRDLKIFFAS
ncbi:hypothetical protein CkaCkLH20_06916 [Colletotrichum karsti]|uniref:Heat shock 70 kDa protein 12B n=1 Tax=Colletotrichum karsti TaxID=1095194 RepID=A0A9P6LK15_9PEZI|nr:uncharacterized protein CkaCkLH20_06916 [Colletotrichum karsti]KAF9875535.1 hypothetical protein CkaCkLH20_06916 [Colletotrichum karsti]